MLEKRNLILCRAKRQNVVSSLIIKFHLKQNEEVQFLFVLLIDANIAFFKISRNTCYQQIRIYYYKHSVKVTRYAINIHNYTSRSQLFTFCPIGWLYQTNFSVGQFNYISSFVSCFYIRQIRLYLILSMNLFLLQRGLPSKLINIGPNLCGTTQQKAINWQSSQLPLTLEQDKA